MKTQKDMADEQKRIEAFIQSYVYEDEKLLFLYQVAWIRMLLRGFAIKHWGQTEFTF